MAFAFADVKYASVFLPGSLIWLMLAFAIKYASVFSANVFDMADADAGICDIYQITIWSDVGMNEGAGV